MCRLSWNLGLSGPVMGLLYRYLLQYMLVARYSDSLRAGRSGDRMPVGAIFSAPVQTGPGAHPASYIMGTGSFPGVKRPGSGVEHPPPSTAEVEGRVELYLYSPSGPSWPVLRWNLLYFISDDRLCCWDYFLRSSVVLLRSVYLTIYYWFVCCLTKCYKSWTLFIIETDMRLIVKKGLERKNIRSANVMARDYNSRAPLQNIIQPSLFVSSLSPHSPDSVEAVRISIDHVLSGL